MQPTALLASVLDDDYLGEGRFARDYRDAPAWVAVALLDRERQGLGDAREREVLADVLRRERRLLALGARSPRDLEEAGLGCLALLAARETAHPLAPHPALVPALLSGAEALARAQGGLLRWPASPFGPASATAAIAYGLARAGRAQRGAKLARRVLAGAAAGDALARSLAAAALARAGEAAAAREAIAEAAAVCRDADGLWRGRAEDGGKRFLSYQLFAALAHVEAGERDAATALLEGTWAAAWDGRRLAHDWESGARSAASCSGCNAQAAWLAAVVKDWT